MGMSNILGALVAFSVTALLPASQVVSWGWRVPFIIGLLIVPVGLYLRRTLEETPAFRAESARLRDGRMGSPMVSIFRGNSASLAIGFGISILWAVAVYVLLIFMPVFVQKSFGFSGKQAFGASLVENALFAGGCFVFGAVADRIGHSRMLGIGATLLLIGVPPLFLWLDASRSMVALVLVLSAFGVLVASFTGVAPTVLSGLFPTGLRATGVSLTYNAAFTIFGGFAPALLTWFTVAGAGSVFAPAWYVDLAAVPALVAIAFLNRRVLRLPAESISETLETPIREV
jgi:MHS family proline/betaine transporter-like MFS transporter